MNALDKAPTPWSPDEDGADLYDRNGKLIVTVYLPGDYKPQPKPEDRAAQRELAALIAKLVNAYAHASHEGDDALIQQMRKLCDDLEASRLRVLCEAEALLGVTPSPLTNVRPLKPRS